MDGITMGRFVFHNPHSFWFLPTFESCFGNTLGYPKYRDFFEHYYNTHDKIYVCLDESLPLVFGSPRKEFYKWVLINGLNPFKFSILPCDALKKEDVLFIFQYFTLNQIHENPDAFFQTRLPFVEKIRQCFAFKVMHLSHYFANTKKVSDLTKMAKIDLLVAESDLSKHSQFFCKYYTWYTKNVYILPFIPASRFHVITPFSSRNNKAISTGSVIDTGNNINYSEANDFFKKSTVHSMRKEIYENKENIKHYITCRNTFAQPLPWKLRNISKFQWYIQVLKKIFLAYFFGKKAQQANPWSKYNIVTELNSHKMAVVAEEDCGLPGNTFVEAMACGTAYIGKRCAIYDDYGMVKGKHYITYDGTLEDLVKTIQYYQTHEEELEQIAKNGERFAIHHFSAEKICNEFVAYCLRCAKERQ